MSYVMSLLQSLDYAEYIWYIVFCDNGFKVFGLYYIKMESARIAFSVTLYYGVWINISIFWSIGHTQGQ